MSNYLKPQNPLYHKKEDAYFYPLTTVDQIVLEDGSRLNTELSKHLMVDVNNINEAEPNPINADTLGGYAADEYVRKDQYGIELNYSVVGSIEEPANPTQNMIWIQTETPVGRVFFGNDEPNETFMEGDVWICTGDNSSVAFNLLKIGNSYMDMVYPLSVKQYEGGKWVDKTAYTYQNGEWVDWIFYIYNIGNEFVSVTGGWAAKGLYVNAGNGGNAVTPALTKNKDCMLIELTTGNTWSAGMAYTQKPIDLTNYDSLTVKGTTSGNTDAERVISVDICKTLPANTVSYVATSLLPSGDVNITVDISNLVGEHYIALVLYLANATGSESLSMTECFMR